MDQESSGKSQREGARDEQDLAVDPIYPKFSGCRGKITGNEARKVQVFWDGGVGICGIQEVGMVDIHLWRGRLCRDWEFPGKESQEVSSFPNRIP